MRILVAPCTFKESLTASDAARVLADAARACGHDVDEAPLADGGEGTLAALRVPWQLDIHTERIPGPMGTPPISARWGQRADLALVEAAEAIGLGLVPRHRRDPLHATSRGVGTLIARALDAGARRVFVALGGTATVDGGAGMLAALGARLLDADGDELDAVPAALTSLARVDLTTLHPALAGAEITGLVDVDVPLLGPGGARMFMRQKGADDVAMDALEGLLARLHPAAVASTPGAGAAGGLGAAILLAGGRLAPGARCVLDALDIDRRVAAADLVWTGEGRIDEQTLHGKLIDALARACRTHRRPLVAFCGAVRGDPDELRAAGVADVIVITPPGQPLDEAMANARDNLAHAAARVLGR